MLVLSPLSALHSWSLGAFERKGAPLSGPLPPKRSDCDCLFLRSDCDEGRDGPGVPRFVVDFIPVAQWRRFSVFVGKGPLNSTNPPKKKDALFSDGHWASELFDASVGFRRYRPESTSTVFGLGKELRKTRLVLERSQRETPLGTSPGDFAAPLNSGASQRDPL